MHSLILSHVCCHMILIRESQTDQNWHWNVATAWFKPQRVCTELQRPSPAQEYSWPQVDLCGSGVSRYHGDRRHMLWTSTRGASDGNKRAQANVRVHTRTHIYTNTPRGGSWTGKCQEKSESTFSSLSGISTLKISLWRFKYIKSYPLKMQLIYSLLYSH